MSAALDGLMAADQVDLLNRPVWPPVAAKGGDDLAYVDVFVQVQGRVPRDLRREVSLNIPGKCRTASC